MEKGLLSTKSLADYLDMCVSQVYEIKKRDRNFPKSILFSDSDSMQVKKYYLRSDVDRWLEGLRKDKAQ